MQREHLGATEVIDGGRRHGARKVGPAPAATFWLGPMELKLHGTNLQKGVSTTHVDVNVANPDGRRPSATRLGRTAEASCNASPAALTAINFLRPFPTVLACNRCWTVSCWKPRSVRTRRNRDRSDTKVGSLRFDFRQRRALWSVQATERRSLESSASA